MMTGAGVGEDLDSVQTHQSMRTDSTIFLQLESFTQVLGRNTYEAGVNSSSQSCMDAGLISREYQPEDT
jgi:hypothetical protein